MGLFSKKNETVSDEQMADLQRRARKANPRLDSIAGPEAIKRRKAASEQHAKRTQS
jgi:hypothetical protein